MTFQEQIKIALEHSDLSEFCFTEHKIAGDDCILCVPNHIGAHWNAYNLILRSIVYRKSDYFPVSLGLKKFFNWGEHTELTPPLADLTDAHLLSKIDGSCLIISKYKGQFIIRTRGTINAAEKMENGFEIELLMQKYPKIKEIFKEDTCGFSIITEWVSPNNVIVIQYPEPDLYLTGWVAHADYSLFNQTTLNHMAKTFLDVKRPEVFNFNTTAEMITTIEQLKGQEGIVVYHDNDQSILKLKSTEYLAKHRFKASASLETTLDMFLTMGQPRYIDFEKKLTETFDYECFTMIQEFAKQICEASLQVDNLIQGMQYFIDNKVTCLETRKEQALTIIQKYGEAKQSGYLFKLLDGKALDIDDIKKLILTNVLTNNNKSV